jgi:hypothetical protein
MKISCRQHRALRHMNRSLRRSDPHLAAMLAMFARLYAGEAMVSTEQTAVLAVRIWRRLACIATAAFLATAYTALFHGTRRVHHQLVRVCAGIQRQSPSRVAHSAPNP